MEERRKMNNPYEVLGIRENASEAEVKEAYRQLVKKYHPDKYQNNPLADLAEEKLREVNEAYDYIMKNGRNFSGSSYFSGSQRRDPQFDVIRREIDANNLGAAEAMLDRISYKNAEWIFLSGMISYKKGWYDDALSKIQQATNMEPNNQEYRRALNAMVNMNSGYRNAAAGRGYSSSDDMCCQALQCYCCLDWCIDCI